MKTFEVLSVEEGDVSRLLVADIRRWMLELDDVAELRIEDGEASLHPSFSKRDREPIRQGIELVTALG